MRQLQPRIPVREPGQMIEVAAGPLPGPDDCGRPRQAIDEDVFLPARPACQGSDRGRFLVEASHIEITERHGGLGSGNPVSATTRRSAIWTCTLLHPWLRNVSVLGGDVGPSTDSDSQVTSLEGRVPGAILIDSVYFHDAKKVDPSAHVECLQFGAGIDCRAEPKQFKRCSDHDIFIRSWGSVNASPHPLSGFRIENNFFGRPLRGYYSLRLAAQNGRPCEDFLVRNNSALKNMYSDCEARGSPVPRQHPALEVRLLVQQELRGGLGLERLRGR